MKHPEKPDIAIVLGSGLGSLAERIERPERLAFSDLPGLEPTSVPGHKGFVIRGTWAGKRALVFQGRLHFYEGHAWDTVLAPVHMAHALGTRILFTTNAAGGIRDDLGPGSLMLLQDHIDWTRPCPGQRSQKPSPYSTRLMKLLQGAAGQAGLTLLSGVYAQVTGPCYETPAEIRALRSIGVDAVGMSTAREIQAGFELGLECAALSCITNRAAGLHSGPLRHQDVLATATAQLKCVGELLDHFLADLLI